ncbi:MAG: MBL fold metallo-hydrolase [Myxococcota bacterium]|nr:MBL fold metallo-hydrolase [Myxococcota bacterium]
MSLSIQVIASSVRDNYFYLLEASDEVMLIDPLDAPAAIRAVERCEGDLVAVLNTHWHPDHVGGNAAVLEAFPDAVLIAPEAEREQIENFGSRAIDRGISAEDTLSIGGIPIEILETPGHTHGHVSFLIEDHLFSGDVIFSAGVGHCKFGNDPGVFFQTYRDVILHLPDTLTFYPGHDYAKNNLAFGLSILPEDPAMLAFHAEVAELERPNIRLTTLKEQAAINLFFRHQDVALQERLQEVHADIWAEQLALATDGDRDEACFRTLRALRDNW